jgi:hypothetical protein
MDILAICVSMFFGFLGVGFVILPPSQIPDKWRLGLGYAFIVLSVLSALSIFYFRSFIFDNDKDFTKELNGEIAMLSQLGGTYDNSLQDPIIQKKFLELKSDWVKRVRKTLGKYNHAFAGRFDGKERELNNQMDHMGLIDKYDQTISNIPTEEDLLEEFIKELK